MAGRLVVSTLNNDTGVLATQNGMTGIAKAWVNWDGSTAPNNIIRSSFNVSSITYTSTGVFVVNFTTAMANANYSIATGGGNLPQSYGSIIGVYDGLAVPTTTALTLYIAGAFSGFPLVNVARNHVVIFGT